MVDIIILIIIAVSALIFLVYTVFKEIEKNITQEEAKKFYESAENFSKAKSTSEWWK